MKVDSIELTSKAQYTDDDLEKGLNLLFDLHHPEFAYPKYHFAEVPGMKKPSVITIGDSYWWNVFSTGLTNFIFNGSSFWFYGQEAYYDDNRPSVAVNSLNIQQEIEKSNFIIFIYTEGCLKDFGNGIIERLYEDYGGKADPGNGLKPEVGAVEKEIEIIKNDPAWLESVRKKAEKNNVPLDTMLRRDAIYMLNTGKK